MKLYLISQTENDGYDTYDSAVVAAETEEAARQISPSGEFGAQFGSWCKTPAAVTVKCIGDAVDGTEAGVVLASFNAG